MGLKTHDLRQTRGETLNGARGERISRETGEVGRMIKVSLSKDWRVREVELSSLNQKLAAALDRAQRKSEGDFEVFQEQMEKAIDLIEKEAGDGMDDDLAEAIDAIRNPDVEDVDLVVSQAKDILVPRSSRRRA